MKKGAINWGSPINSGCALNAGLQAWWLARPGNSGNTLYSLAGSNHGTLTNGPTWRPSTRLGGSLSLLFDGTNDYVATTYAGISGAAARTTSAWFLTTSAAGADTNYIFSCGATGTATAWRMSVESGAIWNRATGGATGSWGSGYNDGAWHHVVMTMPLNGLMNQVACYVDGISLSGSFGSGTTAINTGTTTPVDIGRQNVSGTIYFTGQLDDIRVYNRAITASEVWNLYTDSITGYSLTLNRLERRWGYVAATGNRRRRALICGGIG